MAGRRPDKQRVSNRPVRAFLLLLGLVCSLPVAAQTQPGTLIQNAATVDYLAPSGQPETSTSNLVEIFTVLPRTAAVTELTRVVPGGSSPPEPVGPASCSLAGSGFVPLPDPVLLGGITIDPNQPQPVDLSTLYHAGEPVFVRVRDADQNLDSAVRETVEVTLSGTPGGDQETLQLTETTVDSGIFAGYLQSVAGNAVPGDCVLQLTEGGQVIVDYVDVADPSDQSTSNALVDPSGLVFDSTLGQPVDGASITLIDNATGQPATVLGDDGISTFPSTIVSGGMVTDSGGTNYQFGPGSFRFPVVAAGDYRLDVQPPAGFFAPSSSTIPQLQMLPGAPFALGPGSFGNDFVIGVAQGFVIDIPLDPVTTELFLIKSASTPVAAVGDFLQYQLELENTSVLGDLSGVEIIDMLPTGLRYQAGSLRLDGNTIPDPVISADGQTLTIAVGILPANGSVIVNYVAEVGAGTPIGNAINQAQATTNGGLSSNVASMSVRIADDLFSDKSILAGRAILGSCGLAPDQRDQGVPGIRIYLEDGRYVVTDEGGRYHFEGLEPGTHVVQVDKLTIPPYLELVACEKNTRFAGSKSSQFVDLDPGSLWRANFYFREIEANKGTLTLSLDSRLIDGRRQVDYRLTVTADNVPVENPRGMVLLPDGLSYVSGSTRINGQSVSDYAQSGPVIHFPLEEGGDWQQEIHFRADIADGLSGELVSKALINFDTPTAKNLKTPVAENRLNVSPATLNRFDYVFTPHFAVLSDQLTAQDESELDVLVEEWRGVPNIRVRAVGHTDGTPISAASQQLFADNYALSEARARSVANYLAQKLSLSPEQITHSGMGPDQPLVAERSAEDRRVNRRVELHVWGEKTLTPETAQVTQASSGMLTVATQDLSAREVYLAAQNAQPLAETGKPMPDLDDPALVEKLTPGIGWVWPADGHYPDIPSVKIAVKHAPEQVAEVSINGYTIEPVSFDGAVTNRAGTVTLSRWRGVNLGDGANELEVVVRDQDLNIVKRLSRKLHYSGGPERGVVVPEASVLIADGRTRPVVAIQMFDRWGEPARPRTVGNFSVDSPHRSWWEIERLNENLVVAIGDRKPVYTVSDGGVAYIELEPTTQSGETTLRFTFEDQRTQEFRVWLKPEAREWVLVGLAEGTVGYNSISDNAQLAASSGIDDDYYQDGRIAFFAKGRIKGEYLLTMAYDTAKDSDESQQSLFGTIDPNRYYSLYGDVTEQGFEASSQEKLFIKIEKNQFYALFGDFETGLTVTDLTRYNRRVNGLHSEYQGQVFSYNAFGANTEQSFVKDEIGGNGTSGLYHLSAGDIVLNSDQITLITRDRFHSEDILSSQTLTRYLDYTIDYLAGTVYFKKPVPSRDELFNPISIIAEYESRNSSEKEFSGGGRAAWQVSDGQFEIGASFIHQGDAGADGELGGIDLRWQLGEATELNAEYAQSDATIAGSASDGDAVIVEFSHQSANLDTRAYYRDQEAGFGLGQQLNSEQGMRKIGVAARAQLNERLDVVGEVFTQENTVSNVSRDVALAELTYRDGNRSATAGFVDASDDDGIGGKQRSQQIYTGGSVQLMDNRLTLRAATEFTVADEDQNSAYPQRTTVGVDYALNPNVTVFSEYETTDGADLQTQMTRVGVRASPWNQMEFNSTLNQQASEFGPRTFATLGLVQGFQVNDKLALDFGLDQSNTIAGSTVQPFEPDFPLPSGNLTDDFVATWAGAMYRTGTWTGTTRMEYRNADSGDHYGWLGGFYREEISGHGFSTSLTLFSDEPNTGGQSILSDLRLSWAYRPDLSEWIILDRLDLIYDSQTQSGLDQRSWRVVNNFNANWTPSRETQFSFQYGVKYVRSNFSDIEYSGFTDLYGVDMRRDINETWDWGLHLGSLHSWNSGTIEYGLGADIGFTVAENMWLSVGYNLLGFHDDDFSQAKYTAQGLYINFRIKADKDVFSDWLKQGMGSLR